MKPICASCGRKWRRQEPGAGVLLTTITDEPGDGLDLSPGCPRIVTGHLCGRCVEAKGESGLLKLIPASDEQSITVFATKEGPVLLRQHTLAPQLVTPPTWFDGRSAFLAKCCKNPTSLKSYCEQMERLGLRTVGGFSSEADRRAVYHFGLMFGQEASSGPPNVFLHPRLIGITSLAYLVKSPNGTEYVGAAAFETVRQNTLVWCWLRPDCRRQGILSHYWPIFESAHQNFRVLTPLSDAMTAFLSRHAGHELTETT